MTNHFNSFQIYKPKANTRRRTLKGMEKVLNDISDELIDACENIKIIEEPFKLERISEQARIRDLESQFQLIRALTQTKKHRMRLRCNTVLENKKNRYPQQAIYEHSRVVLTNYDKNNQHGYINANFIPFFTSQSNPQSKLILTQGPTENTVSDFKSLVYQEKIDCVVMLCRLIQNGKNRCSDYIASTSRNTLELVSSNQKKIEDYLTIKTVSLGESFENHSYDHVYYSQWPDKKVPSELTHICELIKHIKNHKRILIHCSAGLGRSGVIAALLLILKSDLFIKQNQLSIFKTARKMRQHRFGTIQNSEQYQFLYQFFEQYYQSKTN